MPRPTIMDTPSPTTPAKLARLEDRLGHRLPDGYRRFLLESNGGRPVPEAFGKKSGLSSMLSVFFSVGARDALYDLAAQFRKTRKEMPAAVLPIAFDLGGNKICLAIKGKNRGKVYFWDHEGGSEAVDLEALYPEIDFGPPDPDEKPIKNDWPGHPDLTLIADSFDEFLDSFHDIDEKALLAEAKKTQTKATPVKRVAKGKKQPATKPAATRKPVAAKSKPAGTKPATPKRGPRGRRSK